MFYARAFLAQNLKHTTEGMAAVIKAYETPLTNCLKPTVQIRTLQVLANMGTDFQEIHVKKG